MAAHQIVLSDVKSNLETTTSSNVWKSRASLNFKGLPFKTEWVGLEDIEAFLKSEGVEAHPAGSLNAYTLPAIRMPDGRLTMDSLRIARALDELQRGPSLHCEGACESTEETVTKVIFALFPIFSRRAMTILTPASREYVVRTRGAWVGMPFEEWIEKNAQNQDELWAKAEEPIDELRRILSKDPSGPYVLGKVPSFSDFVIGGFWKSFEIVDRPVLERVMAMDERFVAHWEACCEWLSLRSGRDLSTCR